MASRRKPPKTARQGSQATRKAPPQPAKPQGRPTAPPRPRKPTPKARPPAPAPRQAPKAPAKAPPRPAAGRSGGPPAPSAKASSPALPRAAATDDPLDTKPTAYVPGIYSGWITKKTDDGARRLEGGHTCIVFARDVDSVRGILHGQPIKLEEWTPAQFDKLWTPTRFQGKPYPVMRAVDQYLKSYCGWTDKAHKALEQMREGKPVDLNGFDSIEDILGLPTTAKTVKVKRQAMLPTDKRLKRKLRRQARLARMTPAARKAWQDKRTARRKERAAARARARAGA